MLMIQNHSVPARAPIGIGKPKARPQAPKEEPNPSAPTPSETDTKSIRLSKDGSNKPGGPLFGSIDNQTKSDSCFKQILNSKLCLAIAGLITAGVLLLKRRFGRKPPTPPSDNSQPVRPASPSLVKRDSLSPILVSSTGSLDNMESQEKAKEDVPSTQTFQPAIREQGLKSPSEEHLQTDEPSSLVRARTASPKSPFEQVTGFHRVTEEDDWTVIDNEAEEKPKTE
jgi:hypothetical protein